MNNKDSYSSTNINTPDAALSESEGKYRDLVESYESAVASIDSEGIFRFMNKASANDFGGTPESLIGKSIYEIFPPDIAEEQFKVITKVFQTGEGIVVDALSVVKSGPRWYRTSLQPIFNTNGEVKLVFINAVDITERKKVEIELAKANRQTEMLLNRISDSMSAFDKEWRYTYINDSALLTYNKKREDIIGSVLWDLFPDLVGTVFWEKFHEIMKTLMPAEFESQYERTGTWVYVHAYPSEEGLTVFYRDITNRKKSEQALKESEIKYRTLFDSMDAAVLIMEQARCIDCNPAAVELYGLNNKEEIIGTSPLDFAPAEQPDGSASADFVIKNIKLALTEGTQVFEWHTNKKNAQPMVLEVRFTPFHASGQDLFQCIAFDITDRKKKEDEIGRLLNDITDKKEQIEVSLHQKNSLIDELEKAKSLLEKTNSEKDKFFSVIAHDLRSPFSGFLSVTKILASDIFNLTLLEMQDYAKMLTESAESLFNLLNNLLEWARLQQNLIRSNPMEIPLAETLAQNIELQSVQLEQKNIKIIYDFNTDITAYADSYMMNSIIRNLLSNAIKFSNPGSKIEIRIDEYNDDFYLISFKDYGIGIPNDKLGEIFEITNKFKQSGTQGEPSCGLGLILVKDMVMNMDGKVFVASELGKGSCFSFTVKKKISEL
ncbi:MAG: sensor signal transduction histidine kinase [Ignavibacteria bacterium]|nr:sensor signal transduction histidine kinase [Ignavibacteria bacterium]